MSNNKTEKERLIKLNYEDGRFIKRKVGKRIGGNDYEHIKVPVYFHTDDYGNIIIDTEAMLEVYEILLEDYTENRYPKITGYIHPREEK